MKKSRSEQIKSLIDSINGLWWIKREDNEYKVYLNDSTVNIYGTNEEKLGEDNIYGPSWQIKYDKLIQMDYSYKAILDSNRKLMYSVLNGESDRASYKGVWLDENNDLIHLEHQVFCIEKDSKNNPQIIIGYTINDTVKSFAKYLFESMEEQSNQLYKSHEDAIDLAKLLVWSIDFTTDPAGRKILSNDRYKEVLELSVDENDLSSMEDFTSTGFLDEDGNNALNVLFEKYQLLVDNESDEFRELVIKHSSFVNKNIVYLSHNTRIIERFEDGSIKRVGGYITDVTEQEITNEQNRILNDENLLLLRANRLAVQSGKVMIWYLNSKTKKDNVLYFGNDMIFDKLGLKRYNKNYFKLKDFFKTIITSDPESQKLAEVHRSHTHKVQSNIEDTFYRVLVKHKNLLTGELFYLEHNLEVEERFEDGTLKVRGGFITDVTKETVAKKKIKYLLNHDVVTGMLNRHAFEEAVKNYSSTNVYSLILADIDGLKFINDAFGHLQGDQAIIQFGNILQTHFNKYGKTYRIGGDEFAILTDLIDEEKVIQVMNDVRKYIDKIDNPILGFNFSYGLDINLYGDRKFNDMFTNAENVMYRRKLLERKSRKSTTLDTLLDTLNEKTRETKEHCDRLGDYAIKILDGLGHIRTNEHEEMKLLCSVHDIGKITIAEELLSAPRKLTRDEFEKVKTHSESGYKIIRNIVNSDDIANGVLFHHERFDGSGYPIGLKGLEIPLYARILSIVDAYDCMVVGRPYKKRMTFDEIINELVRCKGSQFDPKLVDIFILQIKKGS